MSLDPLSRWNLLRLAAVAGVGSIPITQVPQSQGQTSEEEDFEHPMLGISPGEDEASGDADFEFEIVRTDEEWRELLTEEEFKILRRGGTEEPRSSELWQEDRDGT